MVRSNEPPLAFLRNKYDSSEIFLGFACRNCGRSIIYGTNTWLFSRIDGAVAPGYEIHMGKSSYGASCLPFTTIVDGDTGATSTIGVSDTTGRALGTYLHGFFDTGVVVSGMVNAILKKKGLSPLDAAIVDRQRLLGNDLDRLATGCRQSLDMKRIRQIAGL